MESGAASPWYGCENGQYQVYSWIIIFLYLCVYHMCMCVCACTHVCLSFAGVNTLTKAVCRGKAYSPSQFPDQGREVKAAGASHWLHHHVHSQETK